MIQLNLLDGVVDKETLKELITNQKLGIRDNEKLVKKFELEIYNQICAPSYFT